MSQAPVQSGLVRVTVASGTRRVDLVLPGAVPVAELVPELARSVGLLDPATVYGGYRLVTAEGRELATDAGLIIQGVEDGGLLTVTAGVDDRPPRVYDDVVEAMTDVVEEDLEPWAPGAGRRTALWAAGLLMALGAVALLIQRGSLLAGVAAAVVSAALATGAIVLSRAQRDSEAAVAVAWMASLYGARGRPDARHRGPLLRPAGRGRGRLGRRWSAWSACSASARAAPWSSRRSWSARSSPPPAWSCRPRSSTPRSCSPSRWCSW